MIELGLFLSELEMCPYCIVKYYSLDDYKEGGDIDIFCLDISDVVRRITTVFVKQYASNGFISEVYECGGSRHVQIDIKQGNHLIFKFDLYAALPEYKKIKLREVFFAVTVETADRVELEGFSIKVASKQNDLILRYVEYIEYYRVRPDKIKHLEYIEKSIDIIPSIERDSFFSRLHYYTELPDIGTVSKSQVSMKGRIRATARALRDPERLKDFVKRVLRVVLLPMKLICRIRPIYIMRVDGGIASQIIQYINGCYLKEKGYKVIFELNWYKYVGVDVDGRFVRKYDLETLFPGLNVPKLESKLWRYIYRSYFRFTTVDDSITMDLSNVPKAPLYLDAYYTLTDETRKELEKKYLHLPKAEEILDEDNLVIYREIKNSVLSIGVHIRLGDRLDEYKDGYRQYYVTSMHDNRFKNGVFYIFSDEINKVKKEILPSCEDINCKIVDINGSDKGWCDLYLINQCNHIIAGKGDFAKTAYRLKHDTRSLLIEMS